MIMKKIVLRVGSLILIAILLTLSCFAEGMVFSVLKFELQEKTNWCWVASAINAVHHEMENPRSQYTVVRQIKGTATNWYPNEGGTIFEIEEAAEYASKNTESYTGVEATRSFNSLKNAIKNNDNAVVVCSGYYVQNVRNGGHAVLIDGYAINTNGNYVQYFDPWDGTSHICTYESFCDGTYNGRIYDYTCYNTEVK